MIIYIAGPMTGLTGFNRDSFNAAAWVLEEQGHEVRNPACLPTNWSDYEHYMEIGLAMLAQCDSIVFLPGSEKSTGALREAERATALGILSRPELLSDVLWEGMLLTYFKNGGEL